MTEIFDKEFIERLPDDADEALVVIADHYFGWCEAQEYGEWTASEETDHRIAAKFLMRYAEAHAPTLLTLDGFGLHSDSAKWHRIASEDFQAARDWAQGRLDERRVKRADKAYTRQLGSVSEERAKSAQRRIEASALDEPPNSDIDRIWGTGTFRVFISHTSAHKLAATLIKDHLGAYGISGFVAHQDIKISAAWHEEIETALSSAHALLAILTDDFHTSKWTDQEVGWALGRGIKAIALSAGTVPYGLVGKFQGISTGVIETELAAGKAIEGVMDVLSQDFPSRIARTMARGLRKCGSFKQASAVLARLRVSPYGDADMIKAVEEAFDRNGQCSGLFSANWEKASVIRHLQAKAGRKKGR